MSQIRVEVLGRLRVERDGQEIGDLPAQPVRCALFLFLALERAATRDELAALLWPESDAERARRSLNQTLYELRRRLGGDWVASHRDRVEVTGAVTVDALDFLAALEDGRDEDAFAAFGGAFLEGYHLGETVPFEAWVDRRRSHLSRLHRDLCRRLVRARAADGDPAGALAVARRWAEVDPLEDEAHHHIIALLAEIGRRSEALRHFEEYRDLVARELQVEPLDETLELIARLREGAGGEQREESPPAISGAAPPAWPAAEIRPPPRPPAGRRRVWGWRLGAGVAALVAVLALLWSNPGHLTFGGSAARDDALDPRGIAVLPFLNLDQDPRKEYFSDGITEDLLTSLSRIEGLRVISRTSVMRYKGNQVPVREIARELGVRYVLEGSVRREDDQVRITAQLIDAAHDSHLWAETYDRELTGIFQVQGEIAQRIAEQLRHRLLPEQRARIAAGGTSQLAAYDLLLRGREYLNRPGGADVRKYLPAMDFFRRALQVDPEYAQAYVGLSHAFREQVALPIALRRDSATAYARRAVELDPESAEATAALGLAHMIAGRRDTAERVLRRALQLDPNQVDALAGIARLAWVQGRFDHAVRWQRRAVASDPFSAQQLATLGTFLLDLGDLPGAERAYGRSVELAPDAPASSFMLAQILLIRGDEAAAEERMRALEAAASGHPGTQFLLGRFHAQRGRHDRAAELLARSAELLEAGAGATVSLQRAYVAKKLGQADRAAALLERAEADLSAREREGSHAPRLRLQLHALRGERDRAVEALRRRRKQELAGDLLGGPQIGLYWIDRDPLLEDLRAEAFFQALLRRWRVELDSMRLQLEQAPPPAAGPPSPP